jgi:hypothetical protein
MNNQNYRDMVDDVCNQLPGVWQRIGQRQVKQLPVAAPPPVPITLRFPGGDGRQGMQILYRRHDAYIMGYRTTGGQTYACHNQVANVAGAINLEYNDDYAILGWNRQGLPVNGGGPTVSVPELDQALTSASLGAVTRIPKSSLGRRPSASPTARGKIRMGSALPNLGSFPTMSCGSTGKTPMRLPMMMPTWLTQRRVGRATSLTVYSRRSGSSCNFESSQGISLLAGTRW